MSLELLTVHRGAKAAEMSFRNQVEPFLEGEVRGNPKKNDNYLFTGFRFAKTLGGKHDKKNTSATKDSFK